MKNTFIKSTIILMIGTMFSRMLGFIIKIILTRTIKDGINIYALILPTYSLLITITQLGLTYAISTIMARGKRRAIHIFSSIIPIVVLFNILIIGITLSSANFISSTLLKNPDTYYPIISICFILPFTSISGILKGYFFGKQNMYPNAISSIFEQITRLILLILIIPKLVKISLIYAVSFYIFISAISELVQIFIYMFFLPKNINIQKEDIKIKNDINKEVFSLSIPFVSKNLIGSICYFLEPIILTNVLLSVGYSSKFITMEYGTYTAYVISILTMPGFFTMALNTCLIPEISKNYHNHDKVKHILHACLLISFLLGISFNIITFFKADLLLYLIYNTKKGINYLKFLSIFFPLFYLEGPLMSALQGLNFSKYTMFVTLISSIIKIISLILLSLLKIGLYGLVISEVINIIIIIILYFYKLKKHNYI